MGHIQSFPALGDTGNLEAWQLVNPNNCPPAPPAPPVLPLPPVTPTTPPTLSPTLELTPTQTPPLPVMMTPEPPTQLPLKTTTILNPYRNQHPPNHTRTEQQAFNSNFLP